MRPLAPTRPLEPFAGLEKGATVAVALSGGVDSFAAAWLLKQAGFRPLGLHLVLRRGQDASSAQRAASRLGIELTVLDLTAEFEHLVIEPFVQAYLDGLTPNPCAACNPAVKFGLAAQAALGLGAQCLATGHYTRRVVTGDGLVLLARPHDRAKDQTYFLCRLSPAQAAFALFPLAGLSKNQARVIAAQAGFSPGHGESQDICFLPGGDHAGFIARRKGAEALREGEIVNRDGRVLGRHQGLLRYTVGQRRGLGVPAPRPYYVLELQPDPNRLVVGFKEDTLENELRVREAVWALRPEKDEFRALVQVRSRRAPAPALIRQESKTSFSVWFDQPQPSLAPGQAAAVFDGETLLGGGWIAPGP